MKKVGANMSRGLYIHIPFCKYICSYCDFGKKFIEKQNANLYIKALIKEIELYEPFTDVDTIYIGGGTPSALAHDQLQMLFDKLAAAIDFDQIVEFTFEMNPDDVSVELLKLLKQNKVNRLSIGVQTINDHILELVRRKHTFFDVQKAVSIATNYFDNVSLDFMFNLPTQTMTDVERSLAFIAQSGVNHISYYGLIFEENTILANEHYDYWDPILESDIYEYIQTKLNELGYVQYEIGNYAVPGYESKHNIHYWQCDDYYGLGLSASSYLDNVRYTNTYSLQAYNQIMQTNTVEKIEIKLIDEQEREYEKIMLGLRYYEFVEVGTKIIKQIVKNKQLCKAFDIQNASIRLKKEYYYISNQIILDILEME